MNSLKYARLLLAAALLCAPAIAADNQPLVEGRWKMEYSFKTKGKIRAREGELPDLSKLKPVMKNGEFVRKKSSIGYESSSRTFTFRVGLSDFGSELDFERKRNRAEVMLDRSIADGKYRFDTVGKFCYEMYIPTAEEMQFGPRQDYQEGIGFNPDGAWLMISQWKQADRPGGKIKGAPPVNVNLTRAGSQYHLEVKHRMNRNGRRQKDLYKIPVPEAQWFELCYGIRFHKRDGWIAIGIKEDGKWQVLPQLSPSPETYRTTYPSKKGVNVLRFGMYRSASHINDYVLKFRNVIEDLIELPSKSREEFIEQYLS